MSQTEDTYVPEVEDYVEVTFVGEHDDESPLKGRVTEVEEDPDILATSLSVIIDNGEANGHIHYARGVHEGEDWANVTRYSEFSGTHKLGEEATIRELH